MKKFLDNLFYWLEINLYLFLGHIWAFIGLAFNDVGVTYSNFISSISYIFNGLWLLLIGSIVFGVLFRKKKDFNIFIYIVLQLIIIILWIVWYSSSLIK